MDWYQNADELANTKLIIAIRIQATCCSHKSRCAFQKVTFAGLIQFVICIGLDAQTG